MSKTVEVLLMSAYRFWLQLRLAGSWTVIGAGSAGVLAVILEKCGFVLSEIDDSTLNILIFTLLGAFLPLCSCAAVPLAAALFCLGLSPALSAGLLAAAAFASPAAFCFEQACMGAELAWYCSLVGILSAFCAGLLVRRLRPAPGRNSTGNKRYAFLNFIGLYCAASLAGSLVQWLLGVSVPAAFLQHLASRPSEINGLAAVLMSLSRYTCIPDEIPAAASLTAAGMSPSSAVIYIFSGVLLNFPELSGLTAVCRKNTAAALIGAGLFFAVVFSFIGELLFLYDFVPQFDLSGMKRWTAAAKCLQLYNPAFMQNMLAVPYLLSGTGWLFWTVVKKFRENRRWQM